MELKFFSIDEVKDFVKQLKGTRGGKGGSDDDSTAGATGQAPAPLMPGQGGPGGPTFQQPAFNPQPGPGAGGAGFPGNPSVGVDAATAAIVGRIVAKIDGAIASGQPADAVLTWFRGQCGAEAANATMDQIKQTFLYKLPMASLENIAKLMNA
jgi:hypothetical protein